MNDVVKLTYPYQDVAKVMLEDREHRNTFSPAMINGLLRVFNEIKQCGAKVVVIHGYDNYFCCGGRQEDLFKIFRGEMAFTDLNFFDLLMQCEVPTISAMQGHALGGGLAFGCFADYMILAKEAIYSANFMKYGFTPGMGASYLVPKRFGDCVGREMLFTAQTYQGGVLQEKGVPIPVLPKAEVIDAALEVARLLADKPITALKMLKAHLNKNIKLEIKQVVQDELAMHQALVESEEVKSRIKALF